MSYEHWIELLSTLAAKEENFLKSALPKETEEEIPMDELEADIVKTTDYHDSIILLMESLCNENDWERASNSEWAELS